MPEQGEQNVDVVRVTIRIDIPRVLAMKAAELRNALSEIVALYPNSELSMTMTTPRGRATPPR